MGDPFPGQHLDSLPWSWFYPAGLWCASVYLCGEYGSHRSDYSKDIIEDAEGLFRISVSVTAVLILSYTLAPILHLTMHPHSLYSHSAFSPTKRDGVYFSHLYLLAK